MIASRSRLQTHARLAAISTAAFVATLVRGDQAITLVFAAICALATVTLPLFAGLHLAKHSPISPDYAGLFVPTRAPSDVTSLGQAITQKKPETCHTNSESPRAKRAA